MALDNPDSWQYYKTLQINDPNNVSEDYQMKLEVHAGNGTDDPANGVVYCNNHCENFPNDIRFGTTNNPSTAEQLPQWIESYDSTQATIWVKLPSNGSNTIYMFVGNSSANFYSDGDETFIYYNDGTKTTGWVAWRGDIGDVSITTDGDYLDIHTLGDNDVRIYDSDVAISEGAILKIRYKRYGGVNQSGVGFIRSLASNSFDNALFSTDYSGGWDFFSKKDNNFTSVSVGGTPDFYNFHVYEIAWYNDNGTDTGELWYDGTLKKTKTDYIPTVDLYVYVWPPSESSYGLKIDYIIVRKYADPEPSWSSFSSWNTVSPATTKEVSTSLDALISQPKIELTYPFSVILAAPSPPPPSGYDYDLLIHVSGGQQIQCNCSRWDQENYSLIIETYLNKSQRDILRSNIRPGAVAEMYQLLGRPVYYDTSFGCNTIIIEPVSGTQLSQMHTSKVVYVKRYAERIVDSNEFHIKIEGYISGSIL